MQNNRMIDREPPPPPRRIPPPPRRLLLVLTAIGTIVSIVRVEIEMDLMFSWIFLLIDVTTANRCDLVWITLPKHCIEKCILCEKWWKQAKYTSDRANQHVNLNILRKRGPPPLPLPPLLEKLDLSKIVNFFPGLKPYGKTVSKAQRDSWPHRWELSSKG